MPTYNAQCEICDAVVDYTRPVAECMNTPECCGKGMKKVILTAPKGYVFGKFDAFVSPVDGSVIRGKRELQEHNKRNNVVSMADGYSDEQIKRGEIAPKQKVLSKKELQQDIAEAYSMVRDGYKPTKEVLDED